jgi:carbon monoxide dehydrogenase subunit G
MELTNDFRVALPVERAWAVLTDLERIAPCMPGAQLQEIEGDEHRGIVKVKVGPITAQYKGKATFVSRDEEAHVAVLRAEGQETRGQGNASATITATLTPDGDGTAVTVHTDLTITGKVAQFGRGVLVDVSAKLLDQFVASLESTVLADELPAAAAAAGGGGESDPEAIPAAQSEPITDGVEVGSATGPLVQDGPVTPDTSAAAAEWPTESPVAESPGTESPAVTPPTDRPAIRRIDGPDAVPVDLLGTAGSPVAKRVGPVLAAVAILWVLRKLISRRRP